MRKLLFILSLVFSCLTFADGDIETLIVEQSTSDEYEEVLTVEEMELFNQSLSEMTEEEMEYFLAFWGLDWKNAGAQELEISHSILVVPEGYLAVTGDDARKVNSLVQGDDEDDSVEAVVISEDFSDMVVFYSFNEGYVSIDDWNSIKPKELLKEISENTEKANLNRKKNGISELHVVDWIQEPSLDKHNNTIFWAIECLNEEDGSHIVNSVALRLGRNGFEHIVWVVDKERYISFGGTLDVMLRAHSYDPGYRYTDFSKSDRVASYGIASLVAAIVGGKIVKAGGLVLIFKKLGGFILAGMGAAFYKIKKIFRKKTD